MAARGPPAADWRPLVINPVIYAEVSIGCTRLEDLDEALRLADTLASRATQWVTAEIATITPYAVPQAWARTFRSARWSGVRYAVRHSTSRTRASYALFGPAGGRRRWRRGRRLPLSADHRKRLRTTCGIILFDRPSEEALVFAP